MKRKSRFNRPLMALVVGMGLTAGTACDAILEVENPGSVTPEGLLSGGEAALAVIVDGVYGDIQWQYDDLTIMEGVFTDELVHSGSFPSWDEFERRAILINNTQLDDIYEGLSTARFTGDQAIGAIRDILGGDAESNGHLAMAMALSAYARVLLADAFCEITIDGGPAQSPQTIYQEAVTLFGDAISVATAAGADSTVNLARVGRARARLELGDLGGAASDADLVDPDFEYFIEFSENSDRENNEVFTFTIDRRESSVGMPFWETGDPRVPVCFGPTCPFPTEGEFGPDNETPLWVQMKYMSDNADIRLASGAEAALIADEARGVDVATERSYELWLEAHRLPDMRRRNDPFLAGGQTCWPIPDDEIDTNDNL